MKIFRHFITIFFLIANVEIKIFNIEKRAQTKQLRRKSQKSNAVKIVFTFLAIAIAKEPENTSYGRTAREFRDMDIPKFIYVAHLTPLNIY